MKLPRSSTTVVWSTTRSTLLLITPCCVCGTIPGGGGGAEGFTGSGSCAQTPAQANSAATTIKIFGSVLLMTRREISGPRVDSERREPLRRTKLNFDFSPFAIVCSRAWSVSHNILIAQLHADLRCDVRQIVQAVNAKRAAAGHRCQVA